MTGRILLYTLLAVVLLSACGTGFDTIEDYSGEFISDTDSTWKLMHNFQLAYETKNLEEYMNCFHDDFIFHLLEEDWGQYYQHGFIDTCWYLDLEEEFTSAMFQSDSAEVIELTLLGTSETPWYGDPTGETLQLVRSFDLKVYYMVGGQQQGYRAAGHAVFLVKPDTDGQYRIWQWIDQSEI